MISGPSGSGKTTLANLLLKDRAVGKKLCRSISVTTRKPRTGERAGRDYFFISEAEFKRRRKAKKILEWTRYLGYYYGTDKDFVEEMLGSFCGVVLCLDVVGARRLKRMFPRNAVTIFVLPPSAKELYRRIRQRARSTTEAEISSRLAVAKEEIKAAGFYDYRLRNKNLKKALERLKNIVRQNLPVNRD
ncbi:MAG: guanylate kinase [Candidatus Omnitrophica bacterium]|nr:guanylate kinase [Candidatus Omnitrophota bacterium]